MIKILNVNIKSKIKSKKLFYEQYMRNGSKKSDLIVLENLIIKLIGLISSTKALYYVNVGKKLNNRLLELKTHWSILKTFYNDKKVPLIPPLLIDKKILTDIRTKTNIFNKFFRRTMYSFEKWQCTSIKPGVINSRKVRLT